MWLWDYVTVGLICEITSLAARSMSVQNQPTHSCRGAKAACYGICNVEKKGAEIWKQMEILETLRNIFAFTLCRIQMRQRKIRCLAIRTLARCNTWTLCKDLVSESKITDIWTYFNTFQHFNGLVILESSLWGVRGGHKWQRWRGGGCGCAFDGIWLVVLLNLLNVEASLTFVVQRSHDHFFWCLWILWRNRWDFDLQQVGDFFSQWGLVTLVYRDKASWQVAQRRCKTEHCLHLDGFCVQGHTNTLSRAPMALKLCKQIMFTICPSGDLCTSLPKRAQCGSWKRVHF